MATATILKQELRGRGRGPSGREAFSILTQPMPVPEPREWAERRVRLTAIENHISFDDLLAKLDEAGEMGSDLVVTSEFVWLPVGGGATEEALAAAEATARERLVQVARTAWYSSA